MRERVRLGVNIDHVATVRNARGGTHPDPARAAEMPQPSVDHSPDGGLVGSNVVGVANSAFARLNQAVQESVPPPSAPESGPAVDGNGKTIEDLVKEMLRPMLKDWLDRNLPPMVEREISRLTRR